METAPLPHKTHPMILVAAASVTALSLAGIAAVAGWLPPRGESAPVAAVQAEAPAAQTSPPIASATAPATLQIPAGSTITVEAKPPAARAPAAVRQARPTRVATTQPANDSGIRVENAPPAPVQTAAICRDCGTVESVRELAAKGEGSGLGAIAGGVIGGLLGNRVGGGNGRKVMTVAGAAGGAYAGHEVEKRMRGETRYEVTVRLDDGSVRTYVETQAPLWRSGDRVRIDDGRLRPI